MKVQISDPLEGRREHHRLSPFSKVFFCFLPCRFRGSFYVRFFWCHPLLLASRDDGILKFHPIDKARLRHDARGWGRKKIASPQGTTCTRFVQSLVKRLAKAA
jgi:hypothetical protein